MRHVLTLALLAGAGSVYGQTAMTISESQQTGAFGPDSSAHCGELVTVEGIALSASADFYSGSNSSFYLIDSNGGDYSGILVFAPIADAFEIFVGDSLRITGTIQEYYTNSEGVFSNMTEIVPDDPDTQIEYLGFEAQLPDPVYVDMWNLDPVRHTEHVAEDIESMLVEIEDAVVVDISAPPSWRQFTVADPDGNEAVIRTAAADLDDYGRPPLGASFDLIRGVIYQVYGNYNVMPRNLDDLILSVGPPVISGPEFGPCGATPADALSFSIIITDDTGVDEAFAFYRADGGAWQEYGMERDVDNPALFSVEFPAQPEGTMLEYYVSALDDEGEESAWPEDGEDSDWFPEFYVTGQSATTCNEVQSQTYSDGDASLWQCHEATITGTITMGFSDYGTDPEDTFRNYIIADDSGMYNALYVYNNNTHDIWLDMLERGDNVTITGEITEYNGLTELTYISAFTFNSDGNPTPATTVDLATLTSDPEGWESVLVHLEDVEITDNDLGFGEMEISDGTGTIVLDNEGVWDIAFENGDTIDDLTGIITYNFGAWKINPRDNEDFSGLTDIAEGNLQPVFELQGNFPNPFNPSTRIVYSLGSAAAVELSVYNLNGELVTTLVDGTLPAGSHESVWQAEAMASGLYFARLSVDGDAIDTQRMLLIK